MNGKRTRLASPTSHSGSSDYPITQVLFPDQSSEEHRTDSRAQGTIHKCCSQTAVDSAGRAAGGQRQPTAVRSRSRKDWQPRSWSTQPQVNSVVRGVAPGHLRRSWRHCSQVGQSRQRKADYRCAASSEQGSSGSPPDIHSCCNPTPGAPGRTGAPAQPCAGIKLKTELEPGLQVPKRRAGGLLAGVGRRGVCSGR